MEHIWFGGMHAYWWIFWVVMIILFLMFLEPIPKKEAKKRRENPLEILKRRYATGEIDTEEYEERKSRLEETNSVEKN
ncbi:MAG: hypothetical protein HKN33_18765 [Pyrinomonadaceae bacterium]|nr:hypothetical protein [Pyrinomonadaceae bacterium]